MESSDNDTENTSDLTIEIDQDLYEALAKIAQSQNTTVEIVVANFLRQYTDEHQK